MVGSSAISSDGLAGQRHRDHHPLAHAARELERIGIGSGARDRGCGPAPAPRSPLGVRVAARRPGRARSSTSSICWPTLRIGFSAVRGLWKIIAISRPRTVAQRPARPVPSRSMPPNVMRPPVIRAVGVEQAHDGVGGDRLAGAAFADHADDLAAADRKRDALQRPHDAVRVRNSSREIARSATAGRASRRASSDRCMSRRPSPSRLKQNTASTSASAGEHEGPPLAGDDEAGALGHHDAPFRRRRPHAEADEGQAGRVEDRPAHVERRLHHHRRQDVGDDVVEQHPQRRRCRPCRAASTIAALAAHVDLGARERGSRTAG